MKRYTKWLLGVILVLILGAVGYYYYTVQKYEASLIKTVERNLTEEERARFENRIRSAELGLERTDSDSERYNYYTNKALALKALGRLEEARNEFKKAIKLEPENATAHTNMSSLLTEMNDIKGAEKSLNVALSLKPTSSRWKMLIELHKEKMGATNEELKEIYVLALAQDPYDTDMVIAYATFLGEIGEYQAAKDQWMKAIEYRPKDKGKYEAEIKKLDEKMNPAQ